MTRQIQLHSSSIPVFFSADVSTTGSSSPYGCKCLWTPATAFCPRVRRQLVRLRERDEVRGRALEQDRHELLVQLRRRVPAVDELDDGPERGGAVAVALGALGHVAADEPLPRGALALRHLRVAVAGQVDEVQLGLLRPARPAPVGRRVDGVEVERLRLPGRPARPRELLAAEERVEERALAHVRPPRERHLGRAGGRERRPRRRGADELSVFDLHGYGVRGTRYEFGRGPRVPGTSYPVPAPYATASA